VSEISDPLDELAGPWWDALTDRLGPLALFDAHTHVGQNDPDTYTQTPAELLAGLERAHGARAVVFPMAEPDGYRAANDFVIEAASESDGVLTPYCRVNPHDDAVAEATRALGKGARGTKLHPRAEDFTLATPGVADLFALADERRLPILIHAGRGIPALGRDSLELATRHRNARVILAHAAVSDLAWLWREMPDHPNLFIDTSWWNPGDMISLFGLVPPGQILWASDSPYGQPLSSAVQHLRYAVEAGLGDEAIHSIAGGQLERLLAGDELLAPPGIEGETPRLDPLLERIVSHLTSAVGVAIAGEDPAEQLALAKLACAVGEEQLVELCEAVSELIDQAVDAFPQPEGRRFALGARIVVFALTVARTPNAPLPTSVQAA
jgi:predicted TIM-barrel fold metal-dependent hydrolase